MSFIEKVDHAPVSHATYAIPDIAVCEAMLYYAPKGVHDIVDTIRIGHSRLNKDNTVDEFARIGVQVPGHITITGRHNELNDPVYQFCKAIGRFPKGSWELPVKEDRCFAVSATANSGHDPAPYVAFQLLGTKCNKWTNLGIGVGAGYKDPGKLVTGVGHCPLKNRGVCYDPMAQRNRDHSNSWKDQGRSIFDQMSELLKVSTRGGMKNMYTKGYMYGCISQNFAASDATSQENSYKQQQQHTQISWGNHEPWLQVLQVAEMAVILHSITDGGSVFLKIRIFHDSQTQYMCALLASLFETFDIVPVPQQRCGFVLVHYKNKNKISEANLTEITSYLLDRCVDSTAEVFHPPQFCQPTTEALHKVAIASCEMQRYKDDSLHFIASAVRALKYDKQIQNAFTNAGVRIPDVSSQISMTTKLRNEMYRHRHVKGEHDDQSAWMVFMRDIG